jgi:rRNA maturation endonuclease Nob1
MRDKKTYAILEINPLNTNAISKVFNLKKKSAEICVICGKVFNLKKKSAEICVICG